MLKKHFKYEFKTLVRKRWLQILAVTIFGTILFAGYNGNIRVTKRVEDTKKVVDQRAENIDMLVKELDSVERGFDISVYKPLVVGFRFIPISEMDPKSLAFIATGQSDLFKHYATPDVNKQEDLIDYTEVSNPLQRLMGSFDLAFVIIYLLPLIIIAFTYDILSGEQESGSLKLVASQPVSIFKWTLQKVIFRFAILFGITLSAIILTFVVFGFSILEDFGNFLGFVLLVSVYMLFWFALAILTNFLISSASKNASALLGLWVFFVLLLPATVTQLCSNLYPIPSRNELLTEVRDLEAETSKKYDEILDGFLKDHPEYADQEPTSLDTYYQKSMTAEQLVRDKIAPVVDHYDTQLDNQQKLVNRFQYASPSILVQQGLNDLAGTATADYRNFREQVSSFTKEFREFLVPLVFTNTEYIMSHYEQSPKFEYIPRTVDAVWIKSTVLFILSLLILIAASVAFKRKVGKGFLTGG